MSDIDWLELLIVSLIASFGGLIKNLTLKEKNPELRIPVSRYLFSCIISLFVGMNSYFICSYYDVPTYIMLGVTALMGFVGTPFLVVVSEIIMNLIKKKMGEKP